MSAPEELGFTFERRRNGDVLVSRGGRLVTTLRGRAAEELAARLEAAAPDRVQQLLARVTGNYKRGNERAAGSHPRNRGR